MCTPIKQKGGGHWVFNCALKARKKCNFREVLNIFFIVIYRQPKIGISQIWSKHSFKKNKTLTFFITHFFQFLKRTTYGGRKTFSRNFFLAFSWPFSPKKKVPCSRTAICDNCHAIVKFLTSRWVWSQNKRGCVEEHY